MFVFLKLFLAIVAARRELARSLSKCTFAYCRESTIGMHGSKDLGSLLRHISLFYLGKVPPVSAV